MSDQPPVPPQPPIPPGEPGAQQPPVPPAPAYYPPPQPGYAPPQQQPGYAPPPPGYAPPPGGPIPPAGYAPVEPPKKKRRVWIWVVLVIVLLLCCGAAAVVALGGALISKSSADAATLATADIHYKAASAALDAVQSESPGSDAASIEAFKAKSTASLALAKTEIGLSQSSAAKLDKAAARTAYQQGLEALTKRYEALQALAAEESGKTEFSALATDASRLYSEGARKMNESVRLMNKNLYSRAGVEAGRAKSYFQQARAKFTAADAMEETSDLEKVVVYIDLQLDKVDYVIQMANWGVKGNISAYNKAVPKFNAINKKIDASPEPTALSDPNFGASRLEELASQADQANAQAKQMIDKAHALLKDTSS